MLKYTQRVSSPEAPLRGYPLELLTRKAQMLMYDEVKKSMILTIVDSPENNYREYTFSLDMVSGKEHKDAVMLAQDEGYKDGYNRASLGRLEEKKQAYSKGFDAAMAQIARTLNLK